ncbi:hypothetical protein [Kutzneria chonburiensis]|uniref:Uncharacterized protein n=1 Tax=Kutzneria chonburiensis TaxID=1483604 RepID=A0ABV6N5D8_9PSEU|nr:hypothetical protein [Kutzneria chonburiensis]
MVVELMAMLAGIVLAVLTGLSVVRTVVNPRDRSSLAARLTARFTYRTLLLGASKLPHRRRERVLDLCVPLSLAALLGGWLVATGVACWLIAYGLPAGAEDAVRAAGWSLAALEALLFAVYLSKLIEKYQRREAITTRLQARATSLLDAEVVLADRLRGGTRSDLGTAFEHWADWLADIRSSHASCPALLYLRPAGEMCWVEAAVIVLDAAALTEAVAPMWAPPSVRVVLAAGSDCIQRLAWQLDIRLAVPTVSLHGREERAFSDSVRCAVSAGLPAERDTDKSWRAFQDSRTRYAAHADAICSYLRYSNEAPRSERQGGDMGEPFVPRPVF